MISRTKPLKIKEMLSKKLNMGKSRIRLTDKTWEYLNKQETSVTHNLVRELIKNSAYRIIPPKKRSYKIYYGKVKRSDIGIRDKIKPTHKLSYLLKRKVESPKTVWMKKIRQIRAYLKSKKSEIGNRTYRTLRLDAKGNKFKSIKDLESRINEKYQQ